MPPFTALTKTPIGTRSCIECHHLVATTLHECPHCGKDPIGLLCIVCMCYMSEGESHTDDTLYPSQIYSELDLYRYDHLHRECDAAIRAEITEFTGRCQHCRLWQPLQDQCPRCGGAPFVVDVCCYCHLPVARERAFHLWSRPFNIRDGRWQNEYALRLPSDGQRFRARGAKHRTCQQNRSWWRKHLRSKR